MRGSVIKRTRKDGSVVWCIKYLDAQGRQKWETIGPNKRHAERILTDRLRDAHYGELNEDNRLTLDEFLPVWENDKSSQLRSLNSVQSHVRNHISPALGHVPLRDIKLQTVQRQLVDTWTGSPSTLRKVLSTLSGIVKSAAVRGEMEPIDFTSLILPKMDPDGIPTVLTMSQVEHLMSCIDERFAPDVLWLAVTGMRRGEWVALLDKDVNLENRTAYIHRVWSEDEQRIELPKRDKRRRIDLFDRAIEAYEWKRQVKTELGLEKNKWAFPAVRGEMLLPNNFYARIWRPATLRAGFPELRIHDLRHTAASLMIQAGAPPHYVAQQLGHDDPTFTMREYVHWFDSQNQSVVDLINQAFSSKPVASGLSEIQGDRSNPDG